MRLKLITLAIVTTLSTCSTRSISPNAVSSILQNIMSPENTEKAMKIINMATVRNNQKYSQPQIARAVGNDYRLPARAVTANELPARALIASNDMAMPRRVIANEMGIPRAFITKDGVARIISNEPVQPEAVYLPQRNFVQMVQPDDSNFVKPRIVPKEYQSLAVALPKEGGCYPSRPVSPSANMPVAGAGKTPYLPVEAPNPYLPVASPPPFLPPPIQSKGQFLRKIPIPPPML